MEIFGIGPLELLFIVLIAIIVLGPKDMATTAQKAATWLRKLRKSEFWASTKEVMDIPNQVLHESGLDKEIRELKSISQKTFETSVWQPPSPIVDKKEMTSESEPSSINKVDKPGQQEENNPDINNDTQVE